jgi:hypothetical protein
VQYKGLFMTIAVVCVMGLVAVPADAQTDAEAAELAADANAGPPIVIMGGNTDSPIDCGTGTFPTQYYFSDLEAQDGGWVVGGYGDWGWGPIVTGVFEGCDGPEPEPLTVPSGVNVWGTNLNGCYDNSGADSTLTQTFDFSGLAAPIELNVMQWYNVFETFDWAEIYVNGTVVWRSIDSGVYDWALNTIDLSSYAGNASVQIQFLLHSTTVVNRMGWYLDDIEILYCEIPVTLQSISVE